MRTQLRRVFSLILALTMALGLMNMNAFAQSQSYTIKAYVVYQRTPKQPDSYRKIAEFDVETGAATLYKWVKSNGSWNSELMATTSRTGDTYQTVTAGTRTRDSASVPSIRMLLDSYAGGYAAKSIAGMHPNRVQLALTTTDQHAGDNKNYIDLGTDKLSQIVSSSDYLASYVDYVEGNVPSNGAYVNIFLPFSQPGNATEIEPFAAETFTVTWKNGETVLREDEVVKNSIPSYGTPDPVKEGDAQYETYEFAGWTKNGENVILADERVTSNVTYVARFEPGKVKQYQVTFDMGGAIGEAPAAQMVSYGDTASRPADPTWDADHSFEAWTLNGAAYQFTTPVTGELTLVATWHEHVWNDGAITESDCDHVGAVTYTCTCEGCAGTKTEPYGELKEHVWGDWETVTAATCTTDGQEQRVCELYPDDHRDTRAIPSKGHSEGDVTIENAVAATCLEAGHYDRVTYCTVCGEELSRETIETETVSHVRGEDDEENYVEPNHEAQTEGSYDLVTRCEFCGTELERNTVTVPVSGHHGGTPVKENVTEATCTEAGSYDSVTYCDETEDCGYEISRETVEIPALGHIAGEPVQENVVAATCTQPGSYDLVVYCTRCGDELRRETVETPVAGHNWNDWETVMEATCTEDGFMKRTCSVCEEEETQTVEANGHTAVTDAAVPATCEEAGLTEGSHCSACNVLLVAQETIPALGHDYGSEVTTPASCVDDGVMTYVCSRDHSHTYTEVIPATGHTDDKAVKENEIAATCEENGSFDMVTRCAVCKEELARKTEEIPALGHLWGEGRMTKAATCTEAGEMYYLCERDQSHSKTEEIVAHGHNYVVDPSLSTASDCMTKGIAVYVCTYDETHRYTEEADFGDHTYVFDHFDWDEFDTATGAGSVYAVLVCENNEEHIDRVPLSVDVDRTEPDNGKDGEIVYTVTYGDEEDSRSLPIYRISFTDDSGVRHIDVIAGGSVTAPEAAVREGYGVSGWVNGIGNHVNSGETLRGIQGSDAYTAEYVENLVQYSMNVVVNGLDELEPDSITVVVDETERVFTNGMLINRGSVVTVTVTPPDGYEPDDEVTLLDDTDGALAVVSSRIRLSGAPKSQTVTMTEAKTLVFNFKLQEDSGEPTGNEPTGNEPTGNEPTGNEPTGNEPTGNEPTGNEPTGNDGTTPVINDVDVDFDPTETQTIEDEGTPLAEQPDVIAEADNSSGDADIADEDVPLADLPDDGNSDADIADEDVPLADMPEESFDIADEDVPLAEMPEELLNINDAEVPLADVTPQTGDSSMTTLWLGVSLASLGSIIVLLKKREEEENA